MEIKINSQNVHSLGVVLDHLSKLMEAEIEKTGNDLAVLRSYFLDDYYDGYSAEYVTEINKIKGLCQDMQSSAARIVEYSKLFSDI